MLSFLLSPLRSGLLLIAILALTWRWLPRWLAAIGIILACVLLLLMTPLGANLLVHIQESRAPLAEACQAPLPRTIVVLSGGTMTEPRNADDVATLSNASVHRLFAAVDLAHREPDAQWVIAGNSYYDVPESDIMATLAEQLGIPATSIRTETRSRTTWQNAQFVAAMEPPIDKRIWLVTSALHMPRALYAFRSAGFDPCSWPGDYRYRSPFNVSYFLPGSSAIVKSEAALHEFAGELGYRLGLLRSSDRDPTPDSGER